MEVEIDYLMSLDESGVILYDDEADAMANNIKEWMDTPQGHVYGNPEWGNNFNAYKHEPHNETTAVGIESMILVSLPRDVPNVKIYAIWCEPDALELDKYNIEIISNAGAVTMPLTV